jgi:hypothetical protein
MKLAGITKGLVVCLAVVGFCLPQPLFAAVQTNQGPVATDVALHQSPEGNVLTGRVLDQQGAPETDLPVLLLDHGQKLAGTRTDRQGSFRFTNLRGGVYQVLSADAVGIYRVWMPGTAPPSAQPGAMIVTGQDLVRGQYHPFRQGGAAARFWLSHPCVVAGLVATSIAVPVALINCDDDEPKSPK